MGRASSPPASVQGSPRERPPRRGVGHHLRGVVTRRIRRSTVPVCVRGKPCSRSACRTAHHNDQRGDGRLLIELHNIGAPLEPRRPRTLAVPLASRRLNTAVGDRVRANGSGAERTLETVAYPRLIRGPQDRPVTLAFSGAPARSSTPPPPPRTSARGVGWRAPRPRPPTRAGGPPSAEWWSDGPRGRPPGAVSCVNLPYSARLSPKIV